MTVDAKVTLPLPEHVELPAQFGHLTRMRATWVEVNTTTFVHTGMHTTLHGPGIKKDGNDAVKPSSFSLDARLGLDGRFENEEHFHLIPDADWAVIHQAVDMVQAMLDAAREVEEAAA